MAFLLTAPLLGCILRTPMEEGTAAGATYELRRSTLGAPTSTTGVAVGFVSNCKRNVRRLVMEWTNITCGMSNQIKFNWNSNSEGVYFCILHYLDIGGGQTDVVILELDVGVVALSKEVLLLVDLVSIVTFAFVHRCFQVQLMRVGVRVRMCVFRKGIRVKRKQEQQILC